MPGERRSGRPRTKLLSGLSWRWRMAIKVPVYLGLGAAMAIGGLFVYYTMVWPDPLALRYRNGAPVIRILASDGTVLVERGQQHSYIPLDLIPPHVTNAVVATEDHRFYDHIGLDPLGLLRASLANLRAGRYAQGGSTLTQQLAKNLFLNSQRTLSRKLEELLMALWLEIRLSKREILEIYLNRVYFGSGAYGIEGAAQRYFSKSARELTIAEAAVIAGLLKAPSRFSPAASPGLARSRARTVLQRMQTAGLISADEARIASQDSVRFADLNPNRDITGDEYAIDLVMERLPPLSGLGSAEIIVETTIDARLQRAAQQILSDTIRTQGEPLAATQGAVIVLDVTGGIRAVVGGRSYAESQFNRAVKARRQPGSAFKTFVFLAALESGLTPETTAYDLPVSVGGWSPRNESGTHVGAMTLRQALASSVNAVAVRLHMELGVRRAKAVARRLGITSDLGEEPSLALGTSEVTPLELAGAYADLASGGMAVQPHVIRRIRLATGRVLLETPATPGARVVGAEHVMAMNDMLGNAVRRGTGRKSALALHPTAGKTGTTQDFRDAWFAGYSAHLSAVVWVGNDNGRPMQRVTGGSLPAIIWRDVMTVAHRSLPPTQLPGLVDPATPRPADLAQSPPPAPKPAAGVRFPSERIDPDFVARMLKTVQPAASPRAAASKAPGPTALPNPGLRPDDAAIAFTDGRLRQFAPGRMALGRRAEPATSDPQAAAP
jgi:penicillin-binding protein 1A